MTIQHDTLTDPELHEPKGISSAGANTLYIADGLGSGAWLNHSTFADPEIHEPKGVSTAANGTVYIADGLGSGAWLTPPSAVFAAFFVSSPQIITAAGSLTIAHGLGQVPFDWLVFLQCATSEFGYAVGELTKPSHMQDSVIGTGKGVTVVPDATNLIVRYGDDSNTFNVLDKATGAEASITNSNWRLILKAVV